MKTTKILMSAGNPDGFKLEELLLLIQEDLIFKQTQFLHSASDTNLRIAQNNKFIITSMDHLIAMQNNTMGSIDDDFVSPGLEPGYYIDQGTHEHLAFPVTVDSSGLEGYPDNLPASEEEVDLPLTPEDNFIDVDEKAESVDVTGLNDLNVTKTEK